MPESTIQRSIELNRRLSQFGASGVVFARDIPRDVAGKHVADQLIRSCTAPGANYAEARGAQSSRDFIYKISCALKELQEARHWIWVIQSAFEVDKESISDLLDECAQLERILAASKRTAQTRADSRTSQGQ